LTTLIYLLDLMLSLLNLRIVQNKILLHTLTENVDALNKFNFADLPSNLSDLIVMRAAREFYSSIIVGITISVWLLTARRFYRTVISTNVNGELIDLSKDSLFKVSFDPALKVLLPFTIFCSCDIGFLAMNGIKSKFRNKLKLSNILRLKLTCFSVDVEEASSQNRKHDHCLHTAHYAFDK
ncbi:hypothetical protein T06_1481, partial [Trichinella sp. T6]